MRFFPLETLLHVVVHVMLFGLRLSQEDFMETHISGYCCSGRRNTFFTQIVIQEALQPYRRQRKNVDADSMDVVPSDSPPLEEAYCFIGRSRASRNSFSVRFSHRRPERHTTLSHPLNCLHNFPSSCPWQPAEPFLRKSLSGERRRKTFSLRLEPGVVVIFSQTI